MSNSPRPLLARPSTWSLVALLATLALLPYLMLVSRRAGVDAAKEAQRAILVRNKRALEEQQAKRPLPLSHPAAFTSYAASVNDARANRGLPPHPSLPENPPAYKLDYHAPRFSKRRIQAWLFVALVWALAVCLLVALILREVS